MGNSDRVKTEIGTGSLFKVFALAFFMLEIRERLNIEGTLSNLSNFFSIIQERITALVKGAKAKWIICKALAA